MIPFLDMNPPDVARQIGYIEEQMWYDITPESLLTYVQSVERMYLSTNLDKTTVIIVYCLNLEIEQVWWLRCDSFPFMDFLIFISCVTSYLSPENATLKDSPVLTFKNHLQATTEWALDEVLTRKDLAARVKALEKLVLTCDVCFLSLPKDFERRQIQRHDNDDNDDDDDNEHNNDNDNDNYNDNGDNDVNDYYSLHPF